MGLSTGPENGKGQTDNRRGYFRRGMCKIKRTDVGKYKKGLRGVEESDPLF